MADLTAGYETGVNGNNVLTSDAGNATAWDESIKVNGTGVASIIYDNAQAAHGALSGKYAADGGTGRCYTAWTTALGTVTDHYFRLYLYLTAFPAANLPIVEASQGATRAARIDITTTGKIGGFDNPGAALFTTTTTSVSVNQWVRIEGHIIHSATVGQGEVKLFNDPASETPTETKTGTANKNTLANATDIRFGLGLLALVTNTALWMDSIVANAAAYPGPVPVAAASSEDNAAVAAAARYYHWI